jgi:hypothetical protein
MSATVTENCKVGQHDMCHGYIDTLIYHDTRPCQCACHRGLNPPDYQGALAADAIDYYGGAS